MVGLGAHQETHVKQLLAVQEKNVNQLLAESADSIVQQLSRCDAWIDLLESQLQDLQTRATSIETISKELVHTTASWAGE